MDFIRQNIENFRMAEKKARDLGADADIQKMTSALWDREPAIAKSLAQGDPAELLKLPLDYDKVNGTGLQIARLDQMVNRRLLGM